MCCPLRPPQAPAECSDPASGALHLTLAHASLTTVDFNAYNYKDHLPFKVVLDVAKPSDSSPCSLFRFLDIVFFLNEPLREWKA